jgi:hypothetical protein
MGKRELLLIIGFLVVGVVVYHATSPPPDASKPGFSFGKILDHVRREIGGNRASIDVVSKSRIPLGDDVTELRIVDHVAEVHITGEDRPDINASIQINSRAYTDAEAKQYADRTVLKVDHAASSVVLSLRYPREGRQRASMTLSVPSRLRVRMESRPGKLTIRNVAAVEATSTDGETRISKVGGRTVVNNRGGRLEIEDVGALKLTARGSEITVTGIRGDTSILLEQGGMLRASKLGGPVDVEARNAELTLGGLESTRGPVRVSLSGGSARLNGITSDTRVDGRNSELDIVMKGATPIAVYNNGGQVRLTPPAGGYRLDAVAVEGRIFPEELIEDLGLQYSADGDTKESRAWGDVDGGGPAITVRTTRSELMFRSRETPDEAAAEKDTPAPPEKTSPEK